MLWTQRCLTVVAALAIGLMIAPVADAGWLGFGNRPAQSANAPGVTLAQSGGDTARMDQLEGTIRNLTGQVETLQHQIDELQKQLQKMQADDEFRFSGLEGGHGAKHDSAAAPQAAPAAPAPADNAPVAAAPAPTDTAPAAEAAPAPASNGQQEALGAPPHPLGTLSVPAGGGQQPLDLSALARGDAGAADNGPPAPGAPLQAVAPPSGDAVADYKTAYELFVSGQYASAETAFRQFLGAYPGDQHAPDATYWLGQSLFSRGMYREAALEFVNGHKLYPQGPRAADTMLLLGKSLAGIPEQQAACQTFAAALKQYPTMSNALRQRVISEQANAGC